jgi:hypothetical protein
MKYLVLCVFLVTIEIASVSGQDFANLDFESARIIPLYTNGPDVYIAATNALPGWTAWFGTNHPLTVIPYNVPAAVLLPPVGLYGSNAAIPSGNFGVFLQNGSISQTGLIPTNAASLLFDAQSPFSTPFAVSLGGQNLSYMAISNALNSSGYGYTIYSANISAWAGQVVNLRFSGWPGGIWPGGILDDIRFSSTPVPEPGGVALMALGSGVVIYVSRRKHR